MKRSEKIKIAKRVINILIVIISAIGTMTLVSQAIVISIFWDHMNIGTMAIKGFANTTANIDYYISTLLAILTLIFIGGYEETEEDEWKGFLVIFIVTCLLGGLQTLQIINLNNVMEILVKTETISVEQYYILDIFTKRIVFVCCFLAAALKNYYMKNLQVITDDSYVGNSYKKLI